MVNADNFTQVLTSYRVNVKSIEELQGPYPAVFQVEIHHLTVPNVNTVSGVIEHVPVPEAQPD